MGFGLQVNDGTGRTILDTTDRCLKILGHFDIPTSTSSITFRATHAEFAYGDLFYYAQGNCFNMQGRYVTYPVAMYNFNPSISGTTLTMLCEYYPAYKNSSNRVGVEAVGIRIFYGVC